MGRGQFEVGLFQDAFLRGQFEDRHAGCRSEAADVVHSRVGHGPVPVLVLLRFVAVAGERTPEGVGVGRADPYAGLHACVDEVPHRGVGQQAAAAEDDEVVGEGRGLAHQMAGDQDRAALLGQSAQQRADPDDTLGVEAVGGLVEHDDLGVTEDCGGDAEPLPHAQGVRLHPAPRRRREACFLQYLVDAAERDAVRRRQGPQMVTAGAGAVRGLRVEQGAHVAQGFGERGVGAAGGAHGPHGACLVRLRVAAADRLRAGPVAFGHVPAEIPVLREAQPHWAYALLIPLPLIALYAAVVGLGKLVTTAARRLLGPSAAERLAAMEERTEQLLERNRIARELHDSVGHALTVAVVQAGAARAAGDPAFTDRALDAIEETGRAALEDLERVLGILSESERSVSSRPTLAEADRLLESARASGAKVDAEMTGALETVPGPVSREGYRILQEALTNVLRHAGAVPVQVRVTVGGGSLGLEVRNPLTAAAPGPGRGSGLRGAGGPARRAGADRPVGGRLAGARRAAAALIYTDLD